MNGVHDMGGMHGLGAVAPERNEPIFHAPWEARVLALTLAAGAWGRWTLDASRFARESIAGPDYLAMSYYEKWFTALIALLTSTGLVSPAEAESGRPAAEAQRAIPPLLASQVAAVVARGGPSRRPDVRAPRFTPGDLVQARNLNPVGHTRLPRYARGRAGVVTRFHGAHVFPDTNAHGRGEQPQPLYQVRFEALELWGEGAFGKGAVHLDLWEDYLDRL